MKCLVACIFSLITCYPTNAARMIVLGDSLSDGGYYFGVRFTDPDGTLWHEELADRLGLQRATINSAFDLSGLNLAVGGSLVYDLQSQVDRYNNRYTWVSGDLLGLWIGGNDIRDNPSQNMTILATEIGSIIAQLAASGVDHFIVPNLPDLGAIPESIGDPVLAAARRTGTIAFNTALASELNRREASLSITIEQLDVFSLFEHMLYYADDFGFKYIDLALSDQNSGSPSDYVFWDEIHPTSRSHFILSGCGQALLDNTAPIEVISWSIDINGVLRQTWIATPQAPYSIDSGARIDQLTTTDTFSGSPAYTVEIPGPSPTSGFFQTRKD